MQTPVSSTSHTITTVSSVVVSTVTQTETVPFQMTTQYGDSTKHNCFEYYYSIPVHYNYHHGISNIIDTVLSGTSQNNNNCSGNGNGDGNNGGNDSCGCNGNHNGNDNCGCGGTTTIAGVAMEMETTMASSFRSVLFSSV